MRRVPFALHVTFDEVIPVRGVWRLVALDLATNSHVMAPEATGDLAAVLLAIQMADDI